jgi:hypothetical protein
MAMGEDVNAMGTAAMQIAGNELGEAIGPKVSGALEGVESRLADSGSLVGQNIADNMGDIGQAMADGHAQAAALRGDAPPPPAPAADTAAPAADTPAPATDTPATDTAPAADTPPPSTDTPASTTDAPAPDGDLGVNHEGRPVVAEVDVAESHAKVKVTEDGVCEVCSSPCGTVEDKFPAAAQDPELAPQVDAAEALSDPQSQAQAVADLVPELERVEAAAAAKSRLEARVEALEATNAPAGDLIDALDRIDPHAATAMDELADLEQRVAHYEGEDLEPADPTLGEATGESEAARKATYGKQAEQLEANKVRGTAGEQAVLEEILSGDPIPELGSPATLKGSQVHVETTEGLRIIDHLVELPSGELVAIEVKTGAPRNSYQLRCDEALAAQGGLITQGAPGVGRQPGPIRTVEVFRPSP